VLCREDAGIQPGLISLGPRSFDSSPCYVHQALLAKHRPCGAENPVRFRGWARRFARPNRHFGVVQWQNAWLLTRMSQVRSLPPERWAPEPDWPRSSKPQAGGSTPSGRAPSPPADLAVRLRSELAAVRLCQEARMTPSSRRPRMAPSHGADAGSNPAGVARIWPLQRSWCRRYERW